jgi:hypothetical protein
LDDCVTTTSETFPTASTATQWQTTRGTGDLDEAEAEAEVNSTTANEDSTEVRLYEYIRRTELTSNPDDDWEDRRPQRRRYEEPVRVSLRKRVLGLAEGGIFEGPPPTRRPDERPEDQVATLAKMVADNYFDSDLTGEFTTLVLQMYESRPAISGFS